ncbi:hypothetical protein J4410_02120 [Candidatus Woesearchaeota archaeon]|nr:hypothetical protein [Candidatus Woesearchaeota archaeon]
MNIKISYVSRLLFVCVLIILSLALVLSVGCSKKTDVSNEAETAGQNDAVDSNSDAATDNSAETVNQNSDPENTGSVEAVQPTNDQNNPEGTDNDENKTSISSNKLAETTITSDPSTAPKSWIMQDLTDAVNGETITINNYRQKNVIIQSFALNCEVCKEQAEALKVFANTYGSNYGENLVIVTIDMNLDDTSGDLKTYAEQFLQNTQQKWHFVSGSVPASTAFLKKFDTKFLEPDKKQMVLWCDTLRTKTIKGLKTADEIQKEVSSGCN